jgi:DNA-binding SARP family transcriptional activator
VDGGNISAQIDRLIEQSRSFEAAGDIGEAFHHANQAVDLARQAGDAATICTALLGLAAVHFRIGHDAEVVGLAREALELAPPDSRQKVDTLMMLGAAGEGEEDDYMLRRKERYLQVIDLARQIGYHRALIRGLHNLAAGVYMPWGQFELALAADREAAKLVQTYQMPELAWGPLHTMGWILWLTRRRAEAQAVTVELAERAGPGSMGDAYVALIRANLLAEEGNFDEARAAYEYSRGIGEKNGSPEIGIFVRLGLSRVERALEHGPLARTWAEDALELTRRVGYPHQEGNALVECGRAAWCAGDLAAAETYLRAALAKLAPLRAAFELARGSLYLAALLHQQQRPEAKPAWDQALRLVLDHQYDFLLEQERVLVLPFVAAYLDSPDPALAACSQKLADTLLRVPLTPLSVETLGQFSVRVGPRLIAKEALRQRRAGEVLAFLLASPGCTLTSQQITEAMCPEKDPTAAVDFYHHAISSLRRLLEPDIPDRRFPSRYLEANEERVTLTVPPGSMIDFLDYRQRVQRGEWEQAIALYQGEYLPLYRYAEWTLALRQHFADQYDQALLARAAERLSAGDAAACLDLARRALLHNAWQEPAVELGMRAALAMNDRVTALKLYQRLEKDLARELGIAPQMELQQLYLTIKKGRAQ